MGVGVYENNFNGVGGTFIIDQEYFSEDNYEEYVEKLADSLGVIAWEDDEGESYSFVLKDGSESASIYGDRIKAFAAGILAVDGTHIPIYEIWAQDGAEDEFREIKEILTLRGAGFSCSLNLREDRFDLDREFISICFDDYFEIGIRSWETDYIVAVAPRLSLDETLQSDIDIVSTYKRSPSKFKEEIEKMGEILLELARASLLENGHEAWFKTSGYTSSRYTDLDSKREDLASHIKKLQAEYVELKNKVFKDQAYAQERFLEEREEIAQFCSEDLNEGLDVRVPFYEATRDSYLLYSAREEKFVASLKLDVSELIPSLTKESAVTPDGYSGEIYPITGIAGLEVVKALIKNEARKPEHLASKAVFIPADEWVNITKSDILIGDDESEVKEVLFEHRARKMKM